MTGIVLFATGSPILGDVEESLHRAGLSVAAGVRNRPGPDYLPDGLTLLSPDQLTPRLLDLPFLVALFTPTHRQQAAREAAALGFTRPFQLVDPGVPAPRRLALGEGCYVNAGCSLGSGSEFGRFVLVNRGASIGHHARLADFVSIGPGAVLAGEVRAGAGATVGAGATILPGVSLGANAVVAAGAVVRRDVPDGCLVAGHPARIVRRDIGGYKGVGIA